MDLPVLRSVRGLRGVLGAGSSRRPASEDPLFFAFVEVASGRAAGLGSYLRIDPAHGAIEVGHLQFSPLCSARRATEAMYLMMRQAFDLGYRRYEWKCDALNAGSRRAAERLGFTFEGIFRQAIVYKGRSRDTAWYSIVDERVAGARRGLPRLARPGQLRSARPAATLARTVPGGVPMSGLVVYWQPGCTSCLRTKELLRSHGIPFESVDVAGDPAARARLERLGARSVPVVARGSRYVYGQDLEAVARFVGSGTSAGPECRCSCRACSRCSTVPRG